MDEEGNKRCSKDKKISNKSENLIRWIEEKGWYILNDNVKGDWEGEYTYVGAKGSTVIDYVVVDDNIIDKVEEFKMDIRVDSDYMPICLRIRRVERRKKRKDGSEEEEEEQARMLIKWDEEAVQKYRDNTEKTQEEEDQEVEEMWQKLRVWVHKAMIKEEVKIRKRKLGHKDWWDKSCTKKKREMKR